LRADLKTIVTSCHIKADDSAAMHAIEPRQHVMESWDRVGDDLLLDQLAKDDPKAYLEPVRHLLPRVRPKELRRSDRGPGIIMQFIKNLAL
jgi:hypothetical protein